MYVCLSLCLSVCLFFFLSVCVSVCLSVCASVFMCLSAYHYVLLYPYLSVYLPVFLSVRLSVFLSVFLVCLSVYIFVCMYVCIYEHVCYFFLHPSLIILSFRFILIFRDQSPLEQQFELLNATIAQISPTKVLNIFYILPFEIRLQPGDLERIRVAAESDRSFTSSETDVVFSLI
jgi:hypothetical protein